MNNILRRVNQAYEQALNRKYIVCSGEEEIYIRTDELAITFKTKTQKLLHEFEEFKNAL